MKSRFGLLSIAAALMMLMALAAPATAATTHWVNDDDPNGPPYSPPGTSCMDSGFATIQEAVNASAAGDTIRVCDGTYPELAGGPLTINRTLTLLGEQAGIDARFPRGAESIITDPLGTSVSASNVVIDGFTVQDSVAPAFTGFGVWLNPGISGTQILNSIIQNNIVGIGLANLGPSQAVIRHNLIRNNNVPGPATGQGIYTDQFSGGVSVTNVLVEENAFNENSVAGIDVSNTNPAGGVFDLDVDSNSFDMNGRGLLLFNTHDSTIQDNSITNSTAAASAAVRILDNNTNLSVLANDLITGAGHAILVSDLGFVGGPSSGLEIHQNNIEVFAGTGLTVDPLSHVGTVDAECNWWNSPSGPTNVNNPGGTGEEVVGDADFTPWLVAPAPGGACAGPLPTGKVTGGGQINVTGGRGTFGFNARQETTVASGHLNYMNHVTGARLDCNVTLITELTPTTAKFEGTCSPESDASSFKAEVEDNDEPGKSVDKFRITYGATTEGEVLRSGNIQIHLDPATPSSTDAQNTETAATGAGEGSLPAGATFSGISLNGLQVGMGLSIASNNAAAGQFFAVLQGTSALGQAREIEVLGRVTSGSVGSDGSVTFGGRAAVDIGGGSAPLDLPFTVTATAGGLLLELGTSTLPSATLTGGSITIE
jgi:hypothetical protein